MNLLRPLVLLLSIFGSFPASPNVRLGAELPISAPTWIPAAGDRTAIAAVAGGGIGLVLWSDGRAGAYSERSLVATRVKPEGGSLDPLGIHLGVVTPSSPGLLWNGDSFAVARSYEGRNEITFIGTDGSIQERQVIDLPDHYYLAAASQPGSAPRFLFVRRNLESQTSTAIAVVDGHGNIIAHDVALPETPATHAEFGSTAGGGNDEFLLFRRLEPRAYGPAQIHADVISARGEILSSRQFQTDSAFHGTDLVGNADGWVMTSYPYTTLLLFHPDGTARGTTTIPSSLPQPSGTAPWLGRQGEDIVMSWTTGADTQLKSISLIATVNPSGTIEGATEILYERRVHQSPIVARIGTQLIGFYHSMAIRLSDSYAPGSLSLIAFSATRQIATAVADGPNGFLVGWVEPGAGTFVRRVGRDGRLQDESAIAVHEDADIRVSIASAGDVYVIVTSDSSNRFHVRRLRAIDASWIDPAPIPIGDGGHDLASDGLQVVMVWIDYCDNANSPCVRARGIPALGFVLPEIVDLRRAEGHDVRMAGPTIASSGSEFLVAWIEGASFCDMLCPPERTSVRAARLRPDLTLLDKEPLVIEDQKRVAGFTQVVWDGVHFIVAWDGDDNLDLAYFGVRLTKEAATHESNGDEGIAIGSTPSYPPFHAQLVRMSQRMALITPTERASFEKPSEMSLEIVVFDARMPLSEVAALPRTTLAQDIFSDWTSRFGSAAHQTALLVGYSRIDYGVGGVPRVFVRLLDHPQSRRRAVGR